MARAVPLLPDHAPAQCVAWWQYRCIDRECFLSHAQQVAQRLPGRRFALNLCEDRYLFMVAFSALLIRGQTNLLPSSRIERDLQATVSGYPDSHWLRDETVRGWITDAGYEPGRPLPEIATDHAAAVVFTSGSTGRPQPNIKYWGDLVAVTRLAQRRFGFIGTPAASLVVTVPPQHMYGLETSVLLPLLAGVSVYGGRPFFPEDIRKALELMPVPRVLVTTPAHLRVCARAEIEWPAVTFIISATAPLSSDLAARAERIFNAPVLEIYGCTETGSLASRRTLDGELWRLYDGIRINGKTGCAYAPHLRAPVPLNDEIELQGHTRFKLLGRKGDLINIAGKRASLADLNHRLNEIEGVEDGVFIMLDKSAEQITRLTALVVAPRLSERQILAALAKRIDPAFLPRPLRKVERLPRNQTSKLPREELLALVNVPA